MSELVITDEVVSKLHGFIDHGLVKGLGVQKPGKMCVEAAVCAAFGLEHGDSPPCVGTAVREFKIGLNDMTWSSNQARGEGMRRLAVAQLGSNGLDQKEFATRLVIRFIREVLPGVLERVGVNGQDCRNALTIEAAGAAAEAAGAAAEAAGAAAEAARAAAWAVAGAAAWAAGAAGAAWAAAEAAGAVAGAAAWAAGAAGAAWAAAEAAGAAAEAARAAAWAVAVDSILIQTAEMTVQILIEMKSPGCQWLEYVREETNGD